MHTSPLKIAVTGASTNERKKKLETAIIAMADGSELSISAEDLVAQKQQQAEMIADDDPLLISQSLTYVTDDGGTLLTFQSAPFSTGSFLDLKKRSG